VPLPLEDLTDDEATAARLLRQADQLESRARALRYQASDLSVGSDGTSYRSGEA
jgi:hypothetical protein